MLKTIFKKYKTIIAIFILLIVSGASKYISIQKESFPDVSVANIFTTVSLRGISPSDGIRFIAKPIEEELKSVKGIDEIKSDCYQNFCQVQAEFVAGWDSSKALSDVKDAVDMAKTDFPSDAEEPIIKEFSTSEFAIINVNIAGDIPERSLLSIGKKLQTQLESINGVSEVEMGGEREDQVDIIIDPAKMLSHNISVAELSNLFNRSNTIIPAGNINSEIGSFPVQIPGLIENFGDIINMPIKSSGDSVIKVRDIANVYKTYEDAEEYVSLNQESVITLEVKKLSTGNILNVIDEVKVIGEKFKKSLPNTVSIFFTADSSKNVRDDLRDLENSVILSILLVLCVVILMLGARSGFLVGMSIPGSFLMGILILSFTGLSMNMMVLFGLILSVGMLVDGAIVVTEYADRKLSQGSTYKEAYYEASKRMALPIISSTATTIAAFSPLLFWPGIVGKFMRYMPISLVCVLISSLFVALIFIPVIGAYMSKERDTNEKKEVSEIEKEIQLIEDGQYDKLKGYNKTYYNIINWALDRPKKIIWSCIGVMFMSFVAFSHSQLGAIFFPETEPNFVYVNIHALGNLSAEEKRDTIRSVEKEILGQKGIKTIYTRSGAKSRDSSEDVIGYIQLELEDWKERITADEIIQNIRHDLKEFPGIQIEIKKEEMGPSQGKPLQIEVSSENENLEDIKDAVEHIKKGVQSIEGFIDIEDTAPLPGIQWEFEIDRAQALKYNLDISSIGQTIQLITQGARLTSYRPADSDDEVWIVLRYPENYRKITELDNIQIPTENGNLPISNFVNIVPKEKVGNIKRVNKNTVMEVRAEVKPDYQLSKELPKVKEWLVQNPIPVEGINIKIRGELEDSNEAMSFLGVAFLNAVFIMGIILLTQFNNFYFVGLILSAIFLSITGVIMGLIMTLSPFIIIMTGIAIISLAGIVVNNNIVLIDAFAEIKETINDKREAVIKTGILRLRPVLLTTITTILGLVPMALRLNLDFFSGAIIMGGPSMDMWSKFSRSVIFGLSFATILTLVFTPCMLYLGELRAEKKAKKKLAKSKKK